MNYKSAIKNLSDVPNKYNKSGGEISGIVKTTNINDTSNLNMLSNSSTGVFVGSHSKTAVINTHTDLCVNTSNGGTNWRVYHEGNKPTAEDIGLVENNEIIVPANNSSGARIKNFSEDKQNFTTLMSSRPDSSVWAMHSIGVNDQQGPIYEVEDPNGDTLTKRHRIYHEGFKPTAADVGALSTSGGNVNGKITIESGYPIVTANNYGLAGKSTDGGIQYMLLMGTDNRVKLSWNNKPVDVEGPMDVKGQFSLAGKKIFVQQPTPTGLGPGDVGAVWITW